MATIAEFKSLIENNRMADFILDLIGEDFDGAVGFRGLYEGEKTGKLHNSNVWNDGNRTSKKLPGTCTLAIAADWKYEAWSLIKDNVTRNGCKVSMYGDGRVALVVGERGTAGEDAGELIISKAKTVYIWEG